MGTCLMGRVFREAKQRTRGGESETQAVGVGSGLCAVGRLGLAEDTGDVVSDGPDAHEQLVGYVLVAPPAATSRSTSNSR